MLVFGGGEGIRVCECADEGARRARGLTEGQDSSLEQDAPAACESAFYVFFGVCFLFDVLLGFGFFVKCGLRGTFALRGQGFIW